jgi:hypothetical protein
MRICFSVTAVFALASAASAAEPGRVIAILVSPIHEAQVVRGDDNGRAGTEASKLMIRMRVNGSC